jgi:hypothetical protein
VREDIEATMRLERQFLVEELGVAEEERLELAWRWMKDAARFGAEERMAG